MEGHMLDSTKFLETLKYELKAKFEDKPMGLPRWTVKICINTNRYEGKNGFETYTTTEFSLTTFPDIIKGMDQSIQSSIANCIFTFEIVDIKEFPNDQRECIRIEPRNIELNHQLEVRYRSGDIDNIKNFTLIESISLPTIPTCHVGRYNGDGDGNQNRSVSLGRRLNSSSYPLLSNQSESILKMVSVDAFTIFAAGEGAWLCQVRKQGDYMCIQKSNGQIHFPLHYPYRTVRFYKDDIIVLVQDWSNENDRLYLQIT